MNKLVLFLSAALIIGYLVYNKSVLFRKSQNSQVNNSKFEEVEKRLTELEQQEGLTTAVVAGGCFWCMEGPFEQIDGVEEVVAGYTGGDVENPTYEQVLTGTTGHREAVKIYYDPNKVSFEEVLNTFWLQIDPTDPGGQFTDRGEQYKTAIYYSNQQEKEIAEKSKQELQSSGKYDKPIATDVLPLTNFFPAEDYHQDYYLHSSERYKRYKKGSGREDFINKNTEF